MTKIRMGFVSNSSSSSFVCVICGEEQSGMDLCLSDTEFCECKNGHLFCKEHLIKDIINERGETETVFDNYGCITEEFGNSESYTKDYDEFPYEVPIIHCPVCQFQKADDNDIVWYFLINADFTKKEWATMIKDQFKTYEEFTKWLDAGRDKLIKRSKETTK